MEITSKFEGTSICSDLNLKIQDLKIEFLLAIPTYRRLYNIVINDTNKNEYQYRKNLIKQLYFLLKITPIMKPELQQSYLQKLQSWYNTNDHKKTQLGSDRLRNMMKEYSSINGSYRNHKDREQRPQSGVNWNKDVPPFLRPYTSKRPNNYHNRPQSYKSKFGQSTKASDKLQSSTQIAIRDFALSIQQEFEISQDFIRKNRTIHPESEPIYEQLFSILNKAGVSKNFTKNNRQKEQNEILFKREKPQFLTSTQQNNFKQNQQNDDNMNSSKGQLQFNNDQDDFEKVSEQSENDQDEGVKQREEEENNFQRKIYTRDQNAIKNDSKPIDGFMYLRHENQNDTLLLKKTNNKYLHLTNNKFVNDSKNDHQIIRNYLNYSRVKSAIKKQFNRKSETKRLLSAKTRSATNFTGGHNKNPRIYSALPTRNPNLNDQKTTKSPTFNPNGADVYDFSNLEGNKQNSDNFFISSTVYDQRKYLDKLYRRPIQQFKKFNKNTISQAELRCKDKNLLTRYDCFLTRQKINPIADFHIQKHNQEALSEIQKIKEKVGGTAKKSISTDSLMRALFIDSYDDIGSTMDYPVDKKVTEAFDWKNRNAYFNMISNGQKKIKKKNRKLQNK